MTECDELIEHFHAQATGQIHLAVIAETRPVAEMYIDVALFREKQAQTVDELCKDIDRRLDAVIQSCLRYNRHIVA